MCTVTIVRTGGGLRLASNRDESRRRRQAHPPFIMRVGDRYALTPQDPPGRGTWIAANSAGLVFALLNLHSAHGETNRPVASRGLIILEVADSACVAEAASRVLSIAPNTFAPCRLLVADDDRLLEIVLGAGEPDVVAHSIDRPLLFTSSSLGDALVDGPRRLLFQQMFGCSRSSHSDLSGRQDAFHAHRWRDRPALSVHMSRPDACTVSTTVVESTAREVRMIYQPAHCAAGTPVGLILNRTQVHDDAPHRSRGEHAAV